MKSRDQHSSSVYLAIRFLARISSDQGTFLSACNQAIKENHFRESKILIPAANSFTDYIKVTTPCMDDSVELRYKNSVVRQALK